LNLDYYSGFQGFLALHPSRVYSGVGEPAVGVRWVSRIQHDLAHS
jgi:hypothetical protein